MIKLYIDGACSLPARKAGYGVVILYEDETPYCISGHITNGTNQIAELFACVVGIQTVYANFEKEVHKDNKIEIYSDSAYLINAFNDNWVKNWEKNGWKTATKAPVKNRELWEKIIELKKYASVTFHKVEGHSGNMYNEMADKLAVYGKNNTNSEAYEIFVKENLCE